VKRYYLAALALTLIALAAAVANGLVSKPYVTDRIISDDLSTLDTEIISYHSQNQQLPATLDQLDTKGDIKTRLKDYEYTPNSGPVAAPNRASTPGLPYSSGLTIQESFTLCATFKTSTNDTRTKIRVPGYFDPSSHDKGRQCFTDTVNAN